MESIFNNKFDVEGTREFVIAIEPNRWLICLELPGEVRQHFHDETRAAIVLNIDSDRVGVTGGSYVTSDDQPARDLEFTPEQISYLSQESVGARCNQLVWDFVNAGGGPEALQKFWDEQNGVHIMGLEEGPEALEALLGRLLGGQ